MGNQIIASHLNAEMASRNTPTAHYGNSPSTLIQSAGPEVMSWCDTCTRRMWTAGSGKKQGSKVGSQKLVYGKKLQS